MDVGGLRWPFLAICVAVSRGGRDPARADDRVRLVPAPDRGGPAADNFTLANYATALSLDAVRSALWNSLLLGFATASIGVVLMGFLSWLIYRSRLPGAGAIEYLLMFPQAVPRLVFAFGMMWAWLVFPIPIYGTLWLLLIAYLTVFLPLGLRTISGVILQIDRSLEESAQMCGATWGYRLRTVTMPLLKPGLVAAWLLLFIASVRELGASILLMGPKAKVITPAIVESWFSTSTELTAAMALSADAGGRRRAGDPVRGGPPRCPGRGRVSVSQASIEVRDLVVRYGDGRGGARRDASRVARRRAPHAARALRAAARRPRCGPSPGWSGRRRARSASAAAPVFSSSPSVNIPAERRGLSMVFQSYAIWPHMSVFDNVAYGLRVRKRPEAEVATRVREALDLVQLGDLGARSASKLSGGQQQRVALARAFVFSPSVLLFDEPLSNLDAKLRAEMRVELKELQRRLDITSVYVTHDLEEALAISDRIIVMRDGVIEQVGTPGEIYDRPAQHLRRRLRGLGQPDPRPPPPRPRARRARGHRDAGRRAGPRHRRAIAAPAPEALMAIRTVRLRLDRDAPGRRRQRVAGAHPPARVPGRLHAVPRGLGRPDAHRALGGAGADGRGRRGLRQRRAAPLRAAGGVRQ